MSCICFSFRITQAEITVQWYTPSGDQSQWPKPCLFVPLMGGVSKGGNTVYQKGPDFDKTIMVVFDALVSKQSGGGHLPEDVVKALDMHPHRLWCVEDGSLLQTVPLAPRHHDAAVDLLSPEVEPDSLEAARQRVQKRTRSLRMNARGTHKKAHPAKKLKLN